MAPEQLPGKCQIKQAKQEDLMKVDIQQFGMTLFFLWGGYQLSNDYQHLAVTTMQWSEMSAIQNKALTKKEKYFKLNWLYVKRQIVTYQCSTIQLERL